MSRGVTTFLMMAISAAAALWLMSLSGVDLKPDSRLVVIGMKGLSWEDVSADKVYLRSVIDGESAYGDIVSRHYESEADIQKSILSGRNRANLEKADQGIWDDLAQDAEHVFVYLDEYDDDKLRELTSGLGEGVTCVLYSEMGNDWQRVSYRKHMPDVERWPGMGVFLAWGQGVKKAEMPVEMGPEDLLPTLLYLTGQKIPSSVDGFPVLGILDDDYYFKKELRFED